jgi:hypothetical protein
MQACLSKTAHPVLMFFFSLMSIRRIAPAGHTSEHFTHSDLHHPLSNPISGRGKSRPFAGRKTLLGHAFTQSWHPTHFRLKAVSLEAPGGRTWCRRAGIPGLETSANPPSVVFSAAFAAAAAAAAVEVIKNERLVSFMIFHLSPVLLQMFVLRGSTYGSLRMRR